MIKEKMDTGGPQKPEQKEILTLIEEIKLLDKEIFTKTCERDSLVSKLYRIMPEDEFKEMIETVKYIDEADPTSTFSKKIFRTQNKKEGKE